MSKVETTVGRNMQLLRKEKKIRPQQMAEQLGVTWQQLHNYETGRTRITEECIAKAAGILGVPVQRLFQPFEGEENGQGNNQ